MKTILVPTDFSDYAMFALRVAASIARKINARIHLVHVYNLPSAGVSHFTYYENFFNEIKENAQQQLEEVIKEPFLKNIPVQRSLMTDRLIWEIVSSEKYKNTDLIVMGSHGKSGFSRVFIGSNTEKVVRMANAPVLTIKKEYKRFNIRKIVFASDFSQEVYDAFKKVKFIINAYQPEVHLLKVITASDFESTPDSMRLLKDFSRRFALKNARLDVYNSEGIESGIIAFSHSINADLVIIPTHGRTGIAHLINGSLAESLVKHEPKPVLSIKIPYGQEVTYREVGSRASYANWGAE